MDEQYLRNRIEEQIALNPDIRSPIEVEVWDHKFLLSGVVETLRERKLAEKTVRTLGATNFQIDITLATQPPVEDEEILTAAQEEISKYPNLAFLAGAASVDDGVLVLKGKVHDLGEAEELIDILSAIRGVKEIQSELKLLPETPRDDLAITNSVEEALHLDPVVHAEFIGATTENGIVKLEGVVQSEEEKERAEEITKNVSGVRGLNNRLEVAGEPSDADQALATEMLRKLEDAEIDLTDVNLVVIGGVAFLDGSVASIHQKDLAEEICRAIPGIVAVRNDLTVAAA